MIKLYNRRHIYLEKKNWEHLSACVEVVDNYVFDSKYLELAHDKLVVYGDGAVLKVGKEVTGHDPNLSSHSTLKVEDYNECESFEDELFVTDFSEILLYLNKMGAEKGLYQFRAYFYSLGHIKFNFIKGAKT